MMAKILASSISSSKSSLDEAPTCAVLCEIKEVKNLESKQA